jgi:hypothetical protein
MDAHTRPTAEGLVEVELIEREATPSIRELTLEASRHLELAAQAIKGLGVGEAERHIAEAAALVARINAVMADIADNMDETRQLLRWLLRWLERDDSRVD